MNVPDNSNLVIFGASGDLTFRKLVPALYHLYQTKQLPDCFFVLGVGRSEYTDEAFRERLAVYLRDEYAVSDQDLSGFFQVHQEEDDIDEEHRQGEDGRTDHR